MISILTQIENRKLAKIAENKVNLQKGLYRLLRMSTCVGEPFDSQHVIKRSSTCTDEAINSDDYRRTRQHLIKVISLWPEETCQEENKPPIWQHLTL